MQARYYDAEIGRFTSKDINPGELELPLGLNSYVYCLDNPIVLTDYNGKEPSTITVGKNYSYSKVTTLKGDLAYAIKVKGQDYFIVSKDNPYLSAFKATIKKMYLSSMAIGLGGATDAAFSFLFQTPPQGTSGPKQLLKYMRKAESLYKKAKAWEKEKGYSAADINNVNNCSI